MKCEKFQTMLPDLLFDPAQVPADARQHLDACSACRNELTEMQATMRLLDEWKAPEPSPYFDVRLSARLREARNEEAPGWLERMRDRVALNSHLRLRPAMTAAFALLLVLGAGSYEGFVNLEHTRSSSAQSVSATVRDLELLDTNAQTLQQMAAFDDSDAGVGPASGQGSVSDSSAASN